MKLGSVFVVPTPNVQAFEEFLCRKGFIMVPIKKVEIEHARFARGNRIVILYKYIDAVLVSNCDHRFIKGFTQSMKVRDICE